MDQVPEVKQPEVQDPAHLVTLQTDVITEDVV